MGIADDVQSRTPYARLRSLETLFVHVSSSVTPRRVQPSRVTEPSVNVASTASSLRRTPTDVEWSYDCEVQPRDSVKHLTTHCTLLLVEHSFLSVGGELAVMTLVFPNSTWRKELATVQVGCGLGTGWLRGRRLRLRTNTSRTIMRFARRMVPATRHLASALRAWRNCLRRRGGISPAH